MWFFCSLERPSWGVQPSPCNELVGRSGVIEPINLELTHKGFANFAVLDKSSDPDRQAPCALHGCRAVCPSTAGCACWGARSQRRIPHGCCRAGAQVRAV